MRTWARLRPLPHSKYEDRRNPNIRVKGKKYGILEWSKCAVKSEGQDGEIKYLSQNGPY